MSGECSHHYDVYSLILAKLQTCLKASLELFFPMSFDPPHTTITSSLVSFSISSYTVFTMIFISAPGFTKLDTENVKPRLC